MVNINEAKNIIKADYGKNISVLLIVDGAENVSAFVDFFDDSFRKVTIVNNYTDSSKYFDGNYHFDIIIIHINKEITKATELIQSIRMKDDNLYILVFSTYIDKLYHVEEHCYCADAILPYPFDSEYAFKFLYRFLKRITQFKEMEYYIALLENNKLFNEEDRDKKNNLDDYSGEKKCIENNKSKNIRFTKLDKISADEFMSTLDHSIVDKIEEFQEELDKYIILLYDIEELDETNYLEKMKDINNILIDFSNTVDSMISFPVISKTFKNLTGFLNSLDNSYFKDKSQKKLLIEVLLGLGKDLELWIKEIFIDKETDDIHYFDASFANTYVEIESLFQEEEIENDEDDLEFF